MKSVTFINVTGDGGNYLAKVPDEFQHTDVIDWVFLMGKECFKPLVPKTQSPSQWCAPSKSVDTLVPKVRRGFDTLVPKTRRDLDRTSLSPKAQTFLDALVPKAQCNPRSMLVLTKKWGWIEALPEISNGPNSPPNPRLVSREWDVTEDRMARLEQRLTRLECQFSKTEKELDNDLYRVVQEMRSKTE